MFYVRIRPPLGNPFLPEKPGQILVFWWVPGNARSRQQVRVLFWARC